MKMPHIATGVPARPKRTGRAGQAGGIRLAGHAGSADQTGASLPSSTHHGARRCPGGELTIALQDSNRDDLSTYARA